MLDENNLTDEQIEKFFASEGGEAPEGFPEDGDALLNEAENAETAESAQESSGDSDAQNAQQASKESKSPEIIIQERDSYRKAMEAERLQRKEDRIESQKKLSALEEEIQQLKQSISQKKEEPEIDFENAPLDALKRQSEQLAEKQKEYDNRIKQEDAKRKSDEEFNAFALEVQSKTHEFIKDNPDYPEAYAFLKETRVNELKIYGLTDKQIAQQLAEDEVSIAALAINGDRNPGEVLYSLARHRGYVSKTQEQISQSTEKLDRIERGASLSKSLGGKGGNVSVDLSMESLEGMSQEDIDRLVSNDETWYKLAGNE